MQLFNLPDSTIVYPAHDYKGRTASSVGEEKAHNPRLTKSREEFIHLMDKLGLPPPKMLEKAVPANLKVGRASALGGWVWWRVRATTPG
jgi:hypothetical protein